MRHAECISYDDCRDASGALSGKPLRDGAHNSLSNRACKWADGQMVRRHPEGLPKTTTRADTRWVLMMHILL